MKCQNDGCGEPATTTLISRFEDEEADSLLVCERHREEYEAGLITEATEQLQDPNPSFRYCACGILGELGRANAEVKSALQLAALHDLERDVRDAAARALQKLGS